MNGARPRIAWRPVPPSSLAQRGLERRRAVTLPCRGIDAQEAALGNAECMSVAETDRHLRATRREEGRRHAR